MNKLSIVMATFNGANYIEDQLQSILPYMSDNDELIISDDGSTDGTREILTKFENRDSRVSVYEGPQKGVVRNFENALFKVKGDIVLFSDQDDIWLPEKLPIIRSLFQDRESYKVVLHDLYICTNEQIRTNTFGVKGSEQRKWRHGVFYNTLFSCYYGCCMSMTRDFVESIIPFPSNTIAYDQLIGLIAEKNQCSLFLTQPLIKRRIHGGNLSKKKHLLKKVLFRLSVWRSFCDSIKSR